LGALFDKPFAVKRLSHASHNLQHYSAVDRAIDLIAHAFKNQFSQLRLSHFQSFGFGTKAFELCYDVG
jgi:hypothetical protein